jgi:plastocyanin
MAMKRVTLTVAASILVALAASAATGVDVKIVQQNKAFSTSALTIKAGDTVTFANDDHVTHNVYSTTPGLAFELRTQSPGHADTVPFPRAGVLDVACAIHPRMKLKLTVLP